MKEIMKCTLISIGISMTIFCIIGIVFDIIFEGNFQLNNYDFTKMVMGCMLIGMGFGIPSVIYQKENVPRAIQVVVHMGIGCLVYTIVALVVGWIPTKLGIGKCALIVIAQIAVAFIIWCLFVIYYRNEAVRINKKIKKMK